MIISKKYADRLIRKGKAVETALVTTENGDTYQAIDRLDRQRVDHYRVDE